MYMVVRLLGVDPGEHVGMAAFDGLNCVDAWETTPAECLETVRQLLEQKALDWLVIERFTLYAGKAAAQTGSTMPTVELIGALKYVWAMWGAGCRLGLPQPSAKQPTIRILKAKGIVSVAKRKKAGVHAFDAEVLGLYWLMNLPKD